MAVSGLLADSRQLVARARSEDRELIIIRCPEANPNPWREKLPKSGCLGPGRLRNLISVGVRASFCEVIIISSIYTTHRTCARALRVARVHCLSLLHTSTYGALIFAALLVTTVRFSF